METRDFLRALGRRAWILLLVPIIAGGVAFAVTMNQPKVSNSTALVLAHPNVAAFGSTVGYVTAFQSALTSTTVVNQVNQATGVPVADLTAGLSAAPSAPNSITFNVTYSGPQSGAVVAQVPQLAAHATLDVLTAPQVTTAQAQATAAADAVAKTTEATAAFSKTTGLYQPAQDYQSLSNQLAQLRLTLAQNEALGTHPYNAASLNASIAQVSGELQKLAPRVAEYQTLRDAQDRAQTALQLANAQLTNVQQQSAAAAASGAVVAGTVTVVSNTQAAVKAAASAAIVAFLLALGLVALIAHRQGRRGTADARVSSVTADQQMARRHAATSATA